MILLIAISIYLCLLTFIYGSVAILLLNEVLEPSNKQTLPLGVVNITGMVILAILAGYLSLFLRIGMTANIILALASMVLYIAWRKEINRIAGTYLKRAKTANKFAILLLLVCSALALIECIDRPKVGDSGLYHVQTIKWIASYGVVPGLGNLHENYGYNSMWFPLCALFSGSFWRIQSVHVTNGLLFIFSISFFLGGVVDILNGASAFSSIVKVAAIPFTFFVHKPQIGSPATDMPVALLTWITFILCLENTKSDQTLRSRVTNVIIIMFAVYALTVKLVALPLVLICLYLFYVDYKAKELPAAWLHVALAVLILIPWVTRNIILSGYLVYPFPYIDLFRPDWKVPYNDVIGLKLLDLGWGRLPGSHWHDAIYMSPLEWIPKWLGWLEYRYKITIVATFVSMLVFIPPTILELRRQSGWMKTRNILYLTACIGIIYWFTFAPDPRYGWGFIFMALVIPLAPVIGLAVVHFSSASRAFMLFVLLLHSLNQCYISMRSLPKTMDMILLPLSYPPSGRLWSRRSGNIVIYGATTGFCWDAPLPCTPILKDELQARGDSLGSGFRIVQTEGVP